jgi:hypothetical protein
VLLSWYNVNWPILTGLNPSLSPTILDETCSTNYECSHDYIIRINPVTSSQTAAISTSSEQSRTLLGNKFFFNYTFFSISLI